MLFSQEQVSFKSLIGKVILFFLAICVAAGIVWSISREVFDEMLSTVNRISQPSERLDLVDDLSTSILNLSQFQNLNPADARKAQVAYYEESQQLIATLDSLENLLVGDLGQLERINNMKRLIIDRDKVFSDYIGIRSQLMNTEELSEQVQNISEIISSKQPTTDSVIKTITKETRTTTLYQPEQGPKDVTAEPEKKRFLGIFKSKKKGAQEVEENVKIPVIKKEEIIVEIDSLVNVSADSSIHEVGRAVQSIEENHRKQTGAYVNREKQLASSIRAMTLELNEIVDELQLDIRKKVNHENAQARTFVNEKIEQMKWILLVAVAVLVIAVYLIILEVNNHSKSRKELIIAKEEALQFGLAKQRFLANMSHEIRTPLQAIIGYTDLISEAQKPALHIVESLKGASNHLLHLVNQVLDYSRIISNNYTIKQEPFDLEKVLLDVLHIVSGNAEKKAITLDYTNQVNLEGYSLIGDPFRLKQILLNLFSNAIRFTPENGTVSLHVTANNRDDADRLLVRMEVRDTGIGMTKAELERIFHEFEQANQDTVNKYGGTGLGLTIVKELVNLQDGVITVQSTPNAGSVFVCTIPYLITDAMQEQLVSLPESPSNSTVSSDVAETAFNGLVWVIDDDRFIREWCGLVLKKMGVRHQTFESGIVMKTQAIPDDLAMVLTDMRMPEMTGEEVCQYIKEQTGNRVNVYVITAQALPEEHVILKNMGFDDIIMKPFQADAIKDLLRRNTVHQSVIQTKQADFSSIEAMTFGDAELLRDILVQFKEDTAHDVALLDDDTIATESAAYIADIIHKLAGRVGQLGALDLAGELRETEVMLRTSSGTLEENRRKQLSSNVRGLLHEIEDYLHHSI